MAKRRVNNEEAPDQEELDQETPEQEESETVTMVFPRDVILSTDDGKRHHFKQGVNEVPAEHVDHWYLAAHGVMKYVKE